MKAFLHGKIHAKKYGGVPDDYADIDDFIDSTKQAVADVRHRAILHSAFGCFLVEKVLVEYGPTPQGRNIALEMWRKIIYNKT